MLPLVTRVVSNQKTAESSTDHLDSVEDGCGCTEIWEHLSEQRDDDVDVGADD